jgi:hypothetical protein
VYISLSKESSKVHTTRNYFKYMLTLVEGKTFLNREGKVSKHSLLAKPEESPTKNFIKVAKAKRAYNKKAFTPQVQRELIVSKSKPLFSRVSSFIKNAFLAKVW